MPQVTGGGKFIFGWGNLWQERRIIKERSRFFEIYINKHEIVKHLLPIIGIWGHLTTVKSIAHSGGKVQMTILGITAMLIIGSLILIAGVKTKRRWLMILAAIPLIIVFSQIGKLFLMFLDVAL